jgi:hypothetical protein
LHLVCNYGMGHQGNFSPPWWSNPCSPRINNILKLSTPLQD